MEAAIRRGEYDRRALALLAAVFVQANDLTAPPAHVVGERVESKCHHVVDDDHGVQPDERGLVDVRDVHAERAELLRHQRHLDQGNSERGQPEQRRPFLSRRLTQRVVRD